MKTITKVLIWLIAFVAACWIAFVIVVFTNENTIKEYSTYCMDNVRSVLWEELENVSMTDAYCSDWSCVYTWGVRYDSTDYAFSCKVYNKDMVDLDLQPLSINIDADEEILIGADEEMLTGSDEILTGVEDDENL